jgi:hypothetical protein
MGSSKIGGLSAGSSSDYTCFTCRSPGKYGTIDGGKYEYVIGDNVVSKYVFTKRLADRLGKARAKDETKAMEHNVKNRIKMGEKPYSDSTPVPNPSPEE